MSDRHIDIELIMALVDGSLPADEAAAAEASLDDAARAELEQQRSVRAALADIEPARMSETERLDMRSAVRRELNLDQAPAAVTAPAPAAAPWYWKALPVLGAAAALVVVIGIGVNLGGLGIGGSGDDGEASDLATTSATESALSGATEESLQFQATTASTAAATTAATTAETTATEAASDAALPPRMMLPDNLGEVSLEDLDALADTVDEGAFRIAEFAPVPAVELLESTSEPGLVCASDLVTDITSLAEIDYFGEATLNGEPVEVYRVFDLEIFSIYVFIAADCSVAAIVQG